MSTLEDLRPNAAVRGVRADGLVTVVSVQWFGSHALNLTYRTAESWWKSFEQTIAQGIQRSTEPESLGVALVRDIVFGGRIDRDHAIAAYNENVKAVRATVPPERLLVHSLGDGWEPLCAHLGVPVPAQPYPSRNTTNDFQNMILKQPPSQ